MKKLILLSSLLIGSSFAFGQYSGDQSTTTGGYTGPSSSNTVSTVKQAEAMRDDSIVTLKGKIVKHLHKDKYLFSDGTGEITIEIDNDDWRGVSVGPNDTVEIIGEVDKDWNSIEIDVDQVKIGK